MVLDFYTVIVLCIIVISVLSFIAVQIIHGEVRPDHAIDIALLVVAINSSIALIFALLTEKQAMIALPQLYGSLFMGGVMEIYVIYTSFSKLFIKQTVVVK